MRNHLLYRERYAKQGGLSKFGVPKNAISTWMKNKDKFFSALQETSSCTKKYLAVITKKWTRRCMLGLFYKGASKHPQWCVDKRKSVLLALK